MGWPAQGEHDADLHAVERKFFLDVGMDHTGANETEDLLEGRAQLMCLRVVRTVPQPEEVNGQIRPALPQSRRVCTAP